jgi:hypothetical protein
MTDFRAVYYGTRCLIQHRNPYNVSELERVVSDEHGERPVEILKQHQAVTLYVNLPSSFIFATPFAVLPFAVARFVWLSVVAVLFVLCAYLAWKIGEDYAPGIALFLVCIVLANSVVIFGGNTAGMAVPLCLIAAWCFLRERFAVAGAVCMALSLAIKPHDSGFVWLYFLLAGGVYRKRALQALAGAVTLGISGVLWLSAVAPHWMINWKENIHLISKHGYINDPGPASIVGFSDLVPVIDLQSIISVFRDDPRIYNSISYLVCGAMLLIWAIRTLKSTPSIEGALVGLATAIPLTLLITYHRPYDAKLLLLTIPACAVIWSRGGRKRWLCVFLISAVLILTGDIPMVVFMLLREKMHLPASGWIGQISTVLFLRPIPIALFAMSIYLSWVYTRKDLVLSSSNDPDHASHTTDEISASEHILV